MTIHKAYEILGDLIHEIDRDVVTGWEVTADYVGGQLSDELTPGQVRRVLRGLADQFGMHDHEDRHATFTSLSVSRTDPCGVRIQLWAHIPTPHIETTPEDPS